jgi:Tfp pilus assembly protein FimT
MSARRRTGHTLAELLVVCAVLAVVARIALPAAQPVVEFRLDAAAGEVVQALRFARQEARRTGAYRALACDAANNQLSVYVPDMTVNANMGKPLAGDAGLVAHPLSKLKNYTINPGQAPAGGNAVLASCRFLYADNTTNVLVLFDGDGNPMGGNVAGGSKAVQALASGAVVVGIGKATRTVTIDVAGRVTTS